MHIYILEHPAKGFTGFWGGLDFYQGRATTSSKADALKLLGLGAREVKDIKEAESQGGAPPSLSSEFETQRKDEEAAGAAKEAEERVEETGAWAEAKKAKLNQGRRRRRVR